MQQGYKYRPHRHYHFVLFSKLVHSVTLSSRIVNRARRRRHRRLGLQFQMICAQVLTLEDH